MPENNIEKVDGVKPVAPKPIVVDKDFVKKATQTALNKYSEDINNPYLFGRGTPFNPEAGQIDKYLTYDSELYGKLGYDPYGDNLKKYNDVTGTGTDLSRAFVGMAKLAKIASVDNIVLGLASNKNSYKDFETVMQNYSSEREGSKSDFWANTILSAGYTGGIIATMAVEELGLAALTGLSAGFSSPVTAPTMAYSLVKGIKALTTIPKVGKIGKTLSALQDLSDVAKATTVFGKFGRGFVKSALPLGDAMDFVRNVDNLKDVSGLVATSKGIGALVRNARKFTMTHSESNMEANMARDSYMNEQYDNWYKNPSNTGEIPEAIKNQININATNVYNDTYGGNAALIYLSNGLLFDNMLKGATMTKNFFKLKELGQLSFKRGATGLAEVGVVKNGLKQFTQNALAKRANLGWVIDKTLSNSVEGFQEVGQDITSNSVKSYYDVTSVGKQTKGGWLSSIYDTVQKGNFAETFASGALMGTVAAPVGLITQGITQATIGGGLKNQYNKLFNSAEYKKAAKSRYDALNKKAQVLTLFFNNQGNYQDVVTKPFFQQANIQEQIFDAASKGDKKDLEDLKHESFGVGVHNLLRHDMENEFIGHLNYMADNFNADQLNEAFGRNDITEATKSEFQQKLRNRVNQVKEYKKNFDEVNESIVNPISITSLNKNNKNYLADSYKYIAFENLKKELVLAKGTIEDKAARMKDLMAKMNSQMVLSSTDIMSLVNVKDLDQQLKLLKTDVEINKDLKKGEQTELNYANTVKRYEALKKYKAALVEYNKAIENKDPDTVDTNDAYEKLFEAFNEYTTLTADYTKLGLTPYGIQSGTAQRVANKQVFDNLFDYITLGQETSQYQTLVNTLLDPDSAGSYVENNIKMQERFEANKTEHIFELLKSYEDKKEASKMLIILHEKGIFFNLDEIDALVKDGIMPSELYDLKTNLPASKEKQQVAQEIIARFYKNLTGKTVVTSSKLGRASAKYKSDNRKTADLLKQYGFKLGQEIDLSNKYVLRKLIRNILKSKSLIPIDKEVLIAVLEGKVEELEGLNIKLKLVDNAELPISIDTDGTVLLDIRHAGREYKNSSLTIENLFISAITQNKITESLKNNPELLGQVNDLMQQVKDNYAKKYPGLDISTEPLFSDLNLFLAEVLNNSEFQNELNKMVDTIDPTQRSLWKSLYQALRSVMGLIIKNKSLLNRALVLATTAVKPNLVSGIAVPVTETTTTTQVTPVEEVTPFDQEPIFFAQEDEVTDNTLTPEQEQTNREIAKEIDAIKKKLQKYIDEEIEDTKERDGKRSRLSIAFTNFIYTNVYLKDLQYELSLINKSPIAFFKYKADEALKALKKDPNISEEYYDYYSQMLDLLTKQKEYSKDRTSVRGQVDDSNRPTTQQSTQEKIDNLNTTIAEKLAKIDVLKTKLTELKGVFSFRKRLKINAELQRLPIEILDLQDELKQLKEQVPVTIVDNVIDAPVADISEVAEYDIDGNIIINNKTPFKYFANDLKEALAKLYGKELNQLTQADINEIQKLLLNTYNYQKAVSDSVNEVEDYYNELAKQNAELAKQGKQQVSANFAEYKRQKAKAYKGKKGRKKTRKEQLEQTIKNDNLELQRLETELADLEKSNTEQVNAAVKAKQVAENTRIKNEILALQNKIDKLKANNVSIYKQLQKLDIKVATKGQYVYDIQRNGQANPVALLKGVVAVVSKNGFKITKPDGTLSGWINYSTTMSGAAYYYFSNDELSDNTNEIQKLEQELTDLESKSVTPDKQLYEYYSAEINEADDKFKSDKNTKVYTFKEILDKETDPITKQLIQLLTPYLNKAGRVYYQDGYYYKGNSPLVGAEGYGGTVDGKGNILIFDAGRFDADTILHELMHDFLFKSISVDKDEVLVNELTRIFNKAKQDASLVERYAYAFSNLDEFVSEVFGNKGFRQELSYVKDFKLSRTDNIFASITKAIKDFLKKEFNFEISNTLLDNIFNAVEYTIANKNIQVEKSADILSKEEQIENIKYKILQNQELLDQVDTGNVNLDYLAEIDKLKKIVDISIFTSKELKDIVTKLKDRSGLIPFTIKDVIQLATSKKIKLNQAAEDEFLIELNKEESDRLRAEKEREEREDATLREWLKDEKNKIKRDKKFAKKLIAAAVKAQEERLAEIDKQLENEQEASDLVARVNKNRALFYAGISKTARRNLRHIITYNADIFGLSETAFKEKLKYIRRQIKLTTQQYRNFEFKTDDVKTELIAELKRLDAAGVLYPSVVYYINKALYKVNSPVLVRMLPDSFEIKKAGYDPLTYNYDIVNRKSLKAPIKKAVTEYQKQKKALLNYEGSADELNVRVMFVNKLGSQKEFEKFKIRDKNQTSGGVADKFFEEVRGNDYQEDAMYPSDFDFRNVIDDIYFNYEKLQDLVKDLYYEIYQEQEFFEEWNEKNRISREKGTLKQEEDDELERIKFYNSKTGKKLLEEYNNNLEAYYESEAFDISNGLYEGDLTDLSEVEQDLYDQAYDDGLYEEELISYEQLEKPKQVVEEKEKTDNELNSLISDQVNMMWSESETYDKITDYIKDLYTKATTENQSDIVFHFALLKFANELNETLIPKEKKALIKLIKSNLSENLYDNQFVVIMDTLFNLNTSDSKNVELVNLVTGETFKLTHSEFISNFQDLIKEDGVFKKLNINSVVSKQEIDYIKDAYYNIFNNFTDYISSESKVSDEDLNNQIIDKFKTCT